MPDEYHIMTPERALEIARILQQAGEGDQSIKITRGFLRECAEACAFSHRIIAEFSETMARLSRETARADYAEGLVKQIGDGFRLINSAIDQIPDDAPKANSDVDADGGPRKRIPMPTAAPGAEMNPNQEDLDADGE